MIDGYCSSFRSTGGPGGTAVTGPAVLVDSIAGTNASGGERLMENMNGSECYTYGDHFATVTANDPTNLRSHLVHEFGHVLGLGHAFGDDNDDSSIPSDTPGSVMNTSATGFNAATGRSEGFVTLQGHLWSYDVDCVDALDQQDARRRKLQYGWRIYTPTTTPGTTASPLPGSPPSPAPAAC